MLAKRSRVSFSGTNILKLIVMTGAQFCVYTQSLESFFLYSPLFFGGARSFSGSIFTCRYWCLFYQTSNPWRVRAFTF